jgi:hypothetical protein
LQGPRSPARRSPPASVHEAFEKPPRLTQTAKSAKRSRSARGTSGAPWPPRATLPLRKSPTTGMGLEANTKASWPICTVIPRDGSCSTVWPWCATAWAAKWWRDPNASHWSWHQEAKSRLIWVRRAPRSLYAAAKRSGQWVPRYETVSYARIRYVQRSPERLNSAAHKSRPSSDVPDMAPMRRKGPF